MEVFTDRRESSESVAPSKERRGGWGPDPVQKCWKTKGMGDVWNKKKSKDSDIPIMVFSSGDPYPLQLIPTTMAAAAAATPGLGPLQLQVTSILWFCLCVCPFAVGHIFPNLSNKISFSSLVFFPLFLFCDPDREQQCPLFSPTLFLMPTASCHRNGPL